MLLMAYSVPSRRIDVLCTHGPQPIAGPQSATVPPSTRRAILAVIMVGLMRSSVSVSVASPTVWLTCGDSTVPAGAGSANSKRQVPSIMALGGGVSQVGSVLPTKHSPETHPPAL